MSLSSMYLRTSSSDSGAVNGLSVIWRRNLPLGERHGQCENRTSLGPQELCAASLWAGR